MTLAELIKDHMDYEQERHMWDKRTPLDIFYRMWDELLEVAEEVAGGKILRIYEEATDLVILMGSVLAHLLPKIDIDPANLENTPYHHFSKMSFSDLVAELALSDHEDDPCIDQIKSTFSELQDKALQSKTDIMLGRFKQAFELLNECGVLAHNIIAMSIRILEIPATEINERIRQVIDKRNQKYSPHFFTPDRTPQESETIARWWYQFLRPLESPDQLPIKIPLGPTDFPSQVLPVQA